MFGNSGAGKSRHALIAAALALVCAVALEFTGASGAKTVIPAHDNILSAQVFEHPPIDPTTAAGRTVSIQIVVAAAPDCTQPDPLEYGILIDSDRKPSTGTAVPGITNFGADARIDAQCTGGVLTSPGHTLNVTVDGGTGHTTIDIQTTVGALPSVHFRWAPYVLESNHLYKVHSPTWGEWETSELANP